MYAKAIRSKQKHACKCNPITMQKHGKWGLKLHIPHVSKVVARRRHEKKEGEEEEREE